MPLLLEAMYRSILLAGWHIYCALQVWLTLWPRLAVAMGWLAAQRRAPFRCRTETVLIKVRGHGLQHCTAFLLELPGLALLPATVSLMTIVAKSSASCIETATCAELHLLPTRGRSDSFCDSTLKCLSHASNNVLLGTGDVPAG